MQIKDRGRARCFLCASQRVEFIFPIKVKNQQYLLSLRKQTANSSSGGYDSQE